MKTDTTKRGLESLILRHQAAILNVYATQSSTQSESNTRNQGN